jgi:hypothetical protein
MTEPSQTDIQQLVIAINAQTQAISELAESNRTLVDYLIQDQVEDLDGAAGEVYLDSDD